MRTAVVRVDVDPLALLAPDQLREGMATLGGLAAEHGAEVVDADLAVMPTNRRQVEVLIAGDDPPDELKRTAWIGVSPRSAASAPGRRRVF